MTLSKSDLGLGPPALSQVIRLVDTPVFEPVAQPPLPLELRPVKVALATRKN